MTDELLDQVWEGQAIEERNLNLTVHYLRKALNQKESGPQFIETLPTQGYRFAVPVRTLEGNGESRRVAGGAPIAREPQPASLFEPLPEDVHRSGAARSKRFSIWVLAVIAIGMATISLAFLLRPKVDPRVKIARCIQLTTDDYDKGGPILTDGVRIYFREIRPEGPSIGTVALEGGGTGTFAFPFSDNRDEVIIPFDISPTRSEILAIRGDEGLTDGQVWVIPILGGTPRRLGEIRASSASWSPDRRQVAFATGGELYVSDAEGRNSKKIVTMPGKVNWPRWSLDGKRLSFTFNEYRDGSSESSLWETKVDTTAPHRLFADQATFSKECCGVWKPDGKLFVFQSWENGRNEIWAVNTQDGIVGKNAPFQLLSGPEDFTKPSFSSDGRQIFAYGSHERGELVRYDSKLREFVPFLGGISAAWITFSKSGYWVAYEDYAAQTVWETRTDGSEKHQITFEPWQVDGISRSPDDTFLAVRARVPGQSYKIYLISSNGGELEPLVSTDSEQGIATWSPDGRRISFGDVPAVFGKANGSEMVHVFDLQKRKLSDIPGSRGLWTTRWSPNGRYLAALTIAQERLMLFDFTSGKWTATQAANVNNPTWSNDSRYIYFDTTARDTIQRLEVASGKLELVTQLGKVSNLSRWSGLAPDNSPLILRDLGPMEVYSLVLTD